MREPFLSKLGVPLTSQAAAPTKESFPLAFNHLNSHLWAEAIDELNKVDSTLSSPAAAWGEAISIYIGLCNRNNSFPISNQGTPNDFIYDELKSHRLAIVRFLNAFNILRHMTVKKTFRKVTMTDKGFYLEVKAHVWLKDPSVPQLLLQQPNPGFHKTPGKMFSYFKKLGHGCEIMLEDSVGVPTPMHWYFSYGIHINHFPVIPGNETPSKAELENFILNIIWMPILRAKRPVGLYYRLI